MQNRFNSHGDLLYVTCSQHKGRTGLPERLKLGETTPLQQLLRKSKSLRNQRTEERSSATAEASSARTGAQTVAQNRGRARHVPTYAISGISSSKLLSNSGMSLWKKE